MQTFIGVVALLAAILTGVGFFEARRIRALRREAGNVARTAAGAAKTFEENSLRLTVLRHTVEKAWSDIDATFEQLPAIEQSRVVGMPPQPLSPEISAAFEDADILLVVCHRLAIVQDPIRMAEYFARLARYWRIIGNYSRALARSENAVNLNRDSVDGHRGLAVTLMYHAAETEMDSELKARLLERAEAEQQFVHALLGRYDSRLLHDLAWIKDEWEDYSTAAQLYREARELDREEAKVERREEDRNITYDLAATLAKDERLEEALVELASVLSYDENWIAAEDDRDFKKLRESAEWGPRFVGLIERVREDRAAQPGN
jgi:tetratricopeptide (TPR) repeat protein